MHWRLKGKFLFNKIVVINSLQSDFMNWVNDITFQIKFQGLTDFLLKGLQLPYFCADHMMKGTPVGDAMK